MVVIWWLEHWSRTEDFVSVVFPQQKYKSIPEKAQLPFCLRFSLWGMSHLSTAWIWINKHLNSLMS